MSEWKRYRRRNATTVVAVQLDLDTPGFGYRKWGAEQRCERGDWLVNHDGDVHTVARETFARTYREVPGTGLFQKVTDVWAKPSERAGSVSTQEGETHFEAGDFLVSNDPDGRDQWAIAAAKFVGLYEPIADGGADQSG